MKTTLRTNTEAAIARGVFGVPTLAIGDALFWGADATPPGWKKRESIHSVTGAAT